MLGLDLPAFAAWQAWEDCAREGGFRVMHEEFCLVCDRPEILLVDDQNRPHNASGPSHRWRDGWSLYHWHGVAVPKGWIEEKGHLTAAEVLRNPNLEVRRAGIEIIGWSRIIDELQGEVVAADADPEVGEVIRLNLPDVTIPAMFLRVRCATGRDFALGLPRGFKATKGYSLPHCAQAFLAGLAPSEWHKPTITA